MSIHCAIIAASSALFSGFTRSLGAPIPWTPISTGSGVFSKYSSVNAALVIPAHCLPLDRIRTYSTISAGEVVIGVPVKSSIIFMSEFQSLTTLFLSADSFLIPW